jgi:superfamily II DNA or RNA helicase
VCDRFVQVQPSDARFKFPWRPYQARVLEEVEAHLSDRHLHVVAAPGSGKTVLGLEVMRRLGAPSLVLAPTLAIRDQWADRFVSLFLPDVEGLPTWISKDIRAPSWMTISTYQGLHAAYTGSASESEPEEEETTGFSGGGVTHTEVLQDLKAVGVQTLVVDEAHHLRNEWWKTLMVLKAALTDPHVVALTATPPYDVEPQEWSRYEELCGPVDAEVSVPELVRELSLCPHQDCVMLSTPSRDEEGIIRSFRDAANRFRVNLLTDVEFIDSIEWHPWLARPEEHIEAILEQPEGASAMMIYLNAAGRAVPRSLLNLLGLSRVRFPSFDLEWAERLVQFILFTDEYIARDKRFHMESLRAQLVRFGGLNRQQVTLRSSREIERATRMSLSKLDRICDIVQLESGNLGESLRLVVLTDFIRRGMLPRTADANPVLNQIGIVPIFERLRRASGAKFRPGVLCGSLVILPEEAVPELLNRMASENLEDALTTNPLVHDETFVRVEVSGAARQRMVPWITSLYEDGHVRILVGTAALLGEGWDAPKTNALILASFVASFMLSTQMRGRAIRSVPGDSLKTANIWHLVCVEPGSPDGGADYEMLQRRMRSFVGVYFDVPWLESGVDRLDLGEPPFDESRVTEINEQMKSHALDRDGLRERWKQAVDEDGGWMAEHVCASRSSLPRRFVFANTISALLFQGLATGLTFFAHSQMTVSAGGSGRFLFLLLGAGAILGAIAALPFTLKAIWLFLRHGPIASSVKQIGVVVLESLLETGRIERKKPKPKVSAGKTKDGRVSCTLENVTPYERSQFLDALQEILGPIENPRYILVRSSRIGFLGRRDYHAVPKALGNNQANAKFLFARWRKRIGRATLCYTRTEQGRRQLLRARNDSLAAAFQRRTDRRLKWM